MNEQTPGDQHEPLRAYPGERFAGETHVFNLRMLVQELHNEAPPTQRGHRQITIFQRKPVTQVLFAFEAGSELPNHTAHGLVTIHVLEGALTVQASGQNHVLGVGHVLVLNPDIPHTVRAEVASAMLLTVHLDAGQREAPDADLS